MAMAGLCHYNGHSLGWRLTTEDHAPALTCYTNFEVILEFRRREGGLNEADAGSNFLSADAV